MRFTFALLVLCSPVHAEDIFKPTGRYAVTTEPAGDTQHQSSSQIVAVVAAPVLYVTSAPFNCPPCRRLEADIEAGRFAGIEIRKASSWPGMKGYPSVRFKDQAGQWKSVTGYDANTRDFLIRTLLPTRQPVQSSSTIVRSGTFQMPHSEMVRLHDRLHNQQSGMNSHWSWPGDIETHLRNVHGVKTFELEN